MSSKLSSQRITANLLLSRWQQKTVIRRILNCFVESTPYNPIIKILVIHHFINSPLDAISCLWPNFHGQNERWQVATQSPESLLKHVALDSSHAEKGITHHRNCHIPRRSFQKCSRQSAFLDLKVYCHLRQLAFGVCVYISKRTSGIVWVFAYLNVKPTNMLFDILSSRSAMSSRALCLSCTSLYLAMSASLLKSSK